jgi:hypothetical protein
MSISEEYIDLFEAYLNGSLSEKETIEFEARLSYDNEFKEQFESYRQIENSIKQHFRNQLKVKFAEMDKQMDSRSRSKIRHLKWWVISGAAAVAMIIIGTFYLKQFNSSIKGNTALVAEYWTLEEGLPVKMSYKGRYDDAMNAYKLEQWEQAEALLLKIDSDTADYFLGVIAYERKDYEKSLKFFNKVDYNSTYYNETQFRLALVHILFEETELAKGVLQSLIDYNTEFSGVSKEILKKI